MLRRLALPLAAFALLSGCSGPAPDGGPAPTAAQAPAVTTVVGLPQEPVLTDTLHLLDRPHLSTRAPDAYEPLRLPVEPFFVQGASGRFDDWWTYVPAAEQRGLAGTLTLWVEVVGQVTRNPNPLAGHCFWAPSLIVGDGDTAEFHDLPCATEPDTVPEGVRRLEFPLDVAGTWPAGTPMHVEFHVQDFTRGPGAQVNVLTASIPHDSTLRIEGLRLPVDASLLLQPS